MAVPLRLVLAIPFMVFCLFAPVIIVILFLLSPLAYFAASAFHHNERLDIKDPVAPPKVNLQS